MNTKSWFVLLLLLVASVVAAEEPAPAEKPAPPQTPATQQDSKAEGPKLLDGMSVLGNQEAPKALVIVPWKSSELGASLGLAPLLDDSRQPVYKEVFMRALSYYEIRSETTHRSKP